MDLRLGRNDGEATYWTVLADVMTSMFFLVVLFVLIQHLRTFAEAQINERLGAKQHEITTALRSDAELGSVRIDSISPDRQQLIFSSDVLFAACSAVLSDRGRHLLLAVGSILSGHQAALEAIQVEGHTDRKRTGTDRCQYATNWELSSERATTVVRLITDSTQLEGAKLSAIGRAQFHPVPGAENDDPVSYARNRRIEITLQYDRRAASEKAN